MRPDANIVGSLVRMALMEDAPWGDLTSATFLPEEATMTAKLVAREAGVLCGEDVFVCAMTLTGAIDIEFLCHDGEAFAKDEDLAVVRGAAAAVLQAERVALNFIQRLSGIATLTAKYVAETSGTKTRIVDTRKTTPGLRVLERYAVRCGGGYNHRFSLSDAVMVKDNHLAVMTANGDRSLTEQLCIGKALLPHTTHVEVEVDRIEQIETVLAAKVDSVLLDNFSIAELRAAVSLIQGRALAEASGGVSLESIREIAATGVDIVSVGALTHSVRSLDLGLDLA